MSRGVKATAEKIKRKTVIKQICNNKGNLKAKQREKESRAELNRKGGKQWGAELKRNAYKYTNLV